jgi:hypothetical protein
VQIFIFWSVILFILLYILRVFNQFKIR